MPITTSGTTITFNDATTQTTAPYYFPTGTVLLFYQASAPTGWTQVTSLNDYDLRLVSGAGGTTGGTTAYSTVFTNQTPTISNTGTVGATTLSLSQIPSHAHGFSGEYGSGYAIPISGPVGGGAYGIPDGSLNGGYRPTAAASSTDSQGGGGSHTHSFSGSATSSAITLNVRYANVIICSKN